MSVGMDISLLINSLLTPVAIFLSAYNAIPLAPLVMVLAMGSVLPVLITTTWKMDFVWHGAPKELPKITP